MWTNKKIEQAPTNSRVSLFLEEEASIEKKKSERYLVVKGPAILLKGQSIEIKNKNGTQFKMGWEIKTSKGRRHSRKLKDVEDSSKNSK